MISLPEQFSAARLTQIDHGFKLMRSLGEQALDRTSRVFALQLDVSRSAVEQTSSAMRQLISARDPRDLLAIGSESQQHLQQNMRSLFDYSRELFSIAAGLTPPVLRDYRVASLDAPAAAPASESDAASSIILQADTPADSPATGAAPEIILQSETAPADPVAPAAIITSGIEPAAAPTTIAKATSEALDLPVAPPHPLAASVPVEVAVEIELPKIAPVEASPPPPAPTTGPVETRGTKGRKK